MNNLVAYEIWAPEGAPWSPWVKPVLFGFLEGVRPEPPQAVDMIDFDWLPEAAGDTALVLDLSGAAALGLALKLAARGFRPVPLYNAIPRPTSRLFEREHPSVVDVESIVAALAHVTHALERVTLPDQAPPAFLLDADRGGVRRAKRGDFDNRSVSFSTDFPSATFLQDRGVKRALLIQVSGDEAALDLEHTLYAWQEGGISVCLKCLDEPGAAVPCTIPRPWRFGSLWQRALVALGLKKHPLGGFGGVIAESSAG
jgi:hypothetical protein